VIPRVMRPEPWTKRALCPEVDPELFFPADGSVITLGSPVRVLCRSCEVRLECLRYALDHCEEGIWGGFTESARIKILTEHNKGRPLEDIIAADNETWFATVEAGRVSARAAQRVRERERMRAKAAQIAAAQPGRAAL